MVFSSLTFLCIFLPVVFVAHQLLPVMAAKNALLIVASLVFYAYGEPSLIPLLLASTIVNYVLGLLVRRDDRPSKLWLVVAVVANLAFLGVFKYASMLVTTVNQIAGASIPVPQIALPLGISFYTFQALSYVIDVYRGQVEPQRNYAHVLLYISFFPQLVAGPIVKYHDIDAQIGSRNATSDEIALGLRRFCCGMGKKVLVSNVMGKVADSLFNHAAELSAPGAWVAALAYLMQIYYDFSGYSDMAIGLGHMFGFSFQENFDYPYVSTSIKEFWRRWHISLSTWFKEYVYIPLGGNRKGRLRAGINKSIVFFLCGLWHGAAWTFVVWGLIHGAFSLMEEFVPIRKLPKALGHIYTIFVVTVAFVIFRADNFAQAGLMLRTMFCGWNVTQASMVVLMERLTPLFAATFVAACVLAMPVVPWLKGRFEASGNETVVRGLSYAGSLVLLVLCVVSLSSGTYNPFIYFRF